MNYFVSTSHVQLYLENLPQLYHRLMFVLVLVCHHFQLSLSFSSSFSLSAEQPSLSFLLILAKVHVKYQILPAHPENKVCKKYRKFDSRREAECPLRRNLNIKETD